MKHTITIDSIYNTPENELFLITRLHQIINGSNNGPFSKADKNGHWTGYKWQLDGTNDWKAQLDINQLTIMCRYNYQEEKLNAVMALAKYEFSR